MKPESQLGDGAGTFGIIAAIFCLLWMLRKCGPAMLPSLFH